jgi:hypothetical protein
MGAGCWLLWLAVAGFQSPGLKYCILENNILEKQFLFRPIYRTTK